MNSTIEAVATQVLSFSVSCAANFERKKDPVGSFEEYYAKG